jgi:hypothetical protein
MTQITLSLRPNVTVLAVLVHPDAYDFEICNGDVFYKIDDEAQSFELPPGKWEIIDLLRDFKDAEERAVLNVAIRSSGGDPSRNYLLLKQLP